MADLNVFDVSKSFGDTPVLQDVSFGADSGEIVCLLGPSGCGKTTLLRIVAGLETLDAGRVVFDGQDMATVAVHERGFGLMFQDFALFPHKDVFGNVAFGLRMEGQDPAKIQGRVDEVLDLVDLGGYGDRKIHELSGGQQQRVALARSLAPNPTLLMLDEPLGSLDRTLREDLMFDLRRILKLVGVTALYVTHDQQEAFAISDRVIILNAGRIEQQGPPLTVYRQPANEFVARFLGMRNLISAQIQGDGPVPEVVTSLGTLRCRQCAHPVFPGEAATLVVRPDAATLLLPGEEEAGAENVIHGRLLNVSFRGSQVKIAVGQASGTWLEFELPGAMADDLPPLGGKLSLSVDPDGLALLAPEKLS
ncbi:MAG: ABC transporter ATP-binding protein [Chloroflexota bacterium]|nr:ABC transporter ATP-binding protein [Chloroflexota bacterium]